MPSEFGLAHFSLENTIGSWPRTSTRPNTPTSPRRSSSRSAAEAREFLFPGLEIPAELEARRRDWKRRLAVGETLATIEGRARARQLIWDRPAVAALHQAYRAAVLVNTDDETDDRLIGAILLHALDVGRESARPLERRTIELAAGGSRLSAAPRETRS